MTRLKVAPLLNACSFDGRDHALKAPSLVTKRAMLLGASGLPEERLQASSSSSSASDRRS